jgi:hypothetical protein
MKFFNHLGILLTASVIASSCTAAEMDKINGTYVAEGEDSMSLTLKEAASGAVTGTLTNAGSSAPVSARRRGTKLTGTIGQPPDGVPFTADISGKRMILDLGDDGDDDKVTFVRSGKTNGAAALAAMTRPSAAREATPAAKPVATRNVVINDYRLSDHELAQLEGAYRVQLPDADFWYDPMLGAWGLKGGPARGFTTPGLYVGGQLQANASGGGTQVSVNGRILHPVDLMALQQITGPIMPGRYFITAMGLAGYEGGPPQWDLVEAAAIAVTGKAAFWDQAASRTERPVRSFYLTARSRATGTEPAAARPNRKSP